MRANLALAAALLAASTCAPKPEPQVPAPPAPAMPKPPSPSGELPTPTPSPSSPSSELPPQQLGAALDFGRDVQPVLARRCDPCHAPGGKMYERLPFDDPATVASHPEGILKRLKGDDRALVERWIAAQPVGR